MTGAVPAADPAANRPSQLGPGAAGNATILSAGSPPADPAPETTPPPTEPPKAPDPGPETEPAREGDGEDGGEEAEPKGAPEQYEFSAPEGITLDPAAVEAFAPVARELNLTQAQAQRVVDLYAGLQAQQAQAHAEQVQQWAVQVRDDPEIGGQRMVDNVEAAVAVLKQFGTPELGELLTSTGLGNHPEMVRFCTRVGKQFAPDKHVVGSQPAQPTDFAAEFYAKMPKPERVR